jgi:hypothetical protein
MKNHDRPTDHGLPVQIGEERVRDLYVVFVLSCWIRGASAKPRRTSPGAGFAGSRRPV